MNKLPEFLTRKYLNWQTEAGAIKTIGDFAKYLDVNRSLLSFWMNGKRIPNEDNVEVMARKLGDEIYDVMSMDRPNPYMKRINKVFEYLPEEIQRRIAEEAEAYEAKNEDRFVQQAQERRKKKKT